MSCKSPDKKHRLKPFSTYPKGDHSGAYVITWMCGFCGFKADGEPQYPPTLLISSAQTCPNGCEFTRIETVRKIDTGETEQRKCCQRCGNREKVS